jgi:hypothetical protein
MTEGRISVLKKLALAVTVSATATLAPASAAPVAPHGTAVAAAEGGWASPVHYRHRHCRRVCHGELYWSWRSGHWRCNGHGHYRGHRHDW